MLLLPTTEAQARNAAFLEGLEQNRLDHREIRRHAAELAELAPDVILAAMGTATVAPLLQATRTIPIVFALVIDPVGAARTWHSRAAMPLFLVSGPRKLRHHRAQ